MVGVLLPAAKQDLLCLEHASGLAAQPVSARRGRPPLAMVTEILTGTF
jgi:hypothetical protein